MEHNVLSGNTDLSPPNLAVSQQQTPDKLLRVDCGREKKTLRRQDHCGVYSDDFPAGGYQRPTGITWIKRRIGLDDIIDQPARLRSQRAAESADHSGGYGALKAVGITDGYHQLSHPDRFRISQGSRHEMIAIDANHRQIRVRIFPDQARFEAPSIRKRHAQL